jgi:hypothetical protein
VALIYYAQMCKIMPCDVVLLSPFPFIEPDWLRRAHSSLGW